MKYYQMFSVGDYDLARFAVRTQGAYGQQYYFPNAPKTKEVVIPINSEGSKIPVQKVKEKTYVKPKGYRKAHTRNIGGKKRRIGQSILRAGKSTAGLLKANSGKLSAIAVVGGGTAYLIRRKKRKRI